jgi:hypothetical protein
MSKVTTTIDAALAGNRECNITKDDVFDQLKQFSIPELIGACNEYHCDISELGEAICRRHNITSRRKRGRSF